MTFFLSLFLTVGLFAPQAQATPAAPTPGGTTPTGTSSTRPAPAPAIGVDPADTAPAKPDGRKRLSPEDLAPQSPTALVPAPTAGQSQAKAQGLGAAAAAPACNTGDFTGRTGSALVQQIKSVDLKCVNDLFLLTGGDARGAFREEQMRTVAYALRDAAGSYPGDNSTSVEQLVLFLRAGYYVQWYHPGDVGTYGTALQTAIRSGLDAFFASAHSRDVTSANAPVLGEAVTLIDSAQENTRYLPVAKRLLLDYNSATWNPVRMDQGLNSVLIVLYRGHQVPGFAAAVKADPTVLDALFTFVTRNRDLLGGDHGRMVYETINELGRFMQYPELLPKLRPYVRTLAEQSSPSGPTMYQRGAAALAVNFYDAANCAYYGTCEDPAKFKAANLTVKYTCSPSIKIVAQALDNAQLGTACTSLTSQDAFFHAVAKDSGPVKDDNNGTIEVVVFHSDFDYQVLAAVIYDINTDNGGMYLEGDPATAGNQPRFLCYENKWARPSFEIWNLNHEYTHYLDGRFNMYGDYDAGQVRPVDWWVEGFAEFVSYSYRKVVNDGAIAVASQHTYKLSELFDTVYATSSQDRVYRWGYLAVRYMLEQHRSDVDAVLAKYRAGDWDGARAILKTTIGTRYDAGFDSWLTKCAAGACATETPGQPQLPECEGGDIRKLDANCVRSNLAATTGNYTHFYVWVPAGTKQIKVTSKGGTGNGDLYYNPGTWAYTNAYTARSAGPDNSETLTVDNPPAGYVFFSLHAKSGFSGVSVTSEF
ncbi:M9 family metallopeptidase [Streptomyces sp. CBMA156]|uniref:M9 family metallopeptidase n=1 Tax=Streptomyces sp. CBMA156 TaxID=1930280 RepID=UPI00166193F3|nr:M9 family metallopeptidase [Streptomyces sp. CBMA156]